jgi:hypothetical protein
MRNLTIDDLIRLKQKQYWRVGRMILPKLLSLKDDTGQYIVESCGSIHDAHRSLFGCKIVIVDEDVIEYVNGDHVRSLDDL